MEITLTLQQFLGCVVTVGLVIAALALIEEPRWRKGDIEALLEMRNGR